MSDTPITDDIQRTVTLSAHGPADTATHNARAYRWMLEHARKLERELAAACARLEVNATPYDGIATRDETIRLLEREVAALKAERAFNEDAGKALSSAEVIGNVMSALLDRDITYCGNAAMLPFESHDQAINHIADARRIVAERLALIRGGAKPGMCMHECNPVAPDDAGSGT